MSCAAANGENHGDVDSRPWRESVHAVLKRRAVDCSQTVEGLRARDLSCSDEVVETRAIETMRNSCVKTSTEWVTNGTLLKRDISRVINNCAEMMWNGQGRSDS